MNDPDVLKRCILGCEHLARVGDDAFEARVRARVGPVSAAFSGSVTLSDIQPPSSYVMVGEGKGGAAGFAKGRAHVALTDAGDGTTTLTYLVDVGVGGRLAQLGSRLIGGAMDQYSKSFFHAFAEIVTAEAEPKEIAEEKRPAFRPSAEVSGEPSEPGLTGRTKALLWVGLGVLILLGVLLSL